MAISSLSEASFLGQRQTHSQPWQSKGSETANARLADLCHCKESALVVSRCQNCDSKLDNLHPCLTASCVFGKLYNVQS